MPLAWIGLATGAAGALGGLFGGSSNNVPAAPNFQNFGQADSIYGQTLGAQNRLAGQGNQYTNNILGNPYAGGYQGAAGQAAGQYGQLGGAAQGASQNLYGAGNTALGAGNAILQQGFDPQNALYNRTQQQVQDQTLAGLAATGTGSTPYGAGVLGQTASNFNIDWQNNQLGRETQAASAYSGLNNTAQNDYAAGGQQGQLGAQSTLAAGQLPYSTFNSIQNTDLAALSAQQGLYGTAQAGAQGYLQDVNQNYSNQLAAYGAQQQQNQSTFGGLGQLFGAGASLWQNGQLGFLGLGGGGDPWAGAGTTDSSWGA
jgi:hypothetical protein